MGDGDPPRAHVDVVLRFTGKDFADDTIVIEVERTGETAIAPVDPVPGVEFDDTTARTRKDDVGEAGAMGADDGLGVGKHADLLGERKILEPDGHEAKRRE